MALFGCASDEQFRDELADEIGFRFSVLMESEDDLVNEELRDSKCDYCNCALRDCSLCGPGAEG